MPDGALLRDARHRLALEDRQRQRRNRLADGGPEVVCRRDILGSAKRVREAGERLDAYGHDITLDGYRLDSVLIAVAVRRRREVVQRKRDGLRLAFSRKKVVPGGNGNRRTVLRRHGVVVDSRLLLEDHGVVAGAVGVRLLGSLSLRHRRGPSRHAHEQVERPSGGKRREARLDDERDVVRLAFKIEVLAAEAGRGEGAVVGILLEVNVADSLGLVADADGVESVRRNDRSARDDELIIVVDVESMRGLGRRVGADVASVDANPLVCV